METSDDPRMYMAAERTVLAWIRTGIALMGFGFLVARFGVFLGELSVTNAVPLPDGAALSLPIGIALVAIGVMTLVWATLRHRHYVLALRRGNFLEVFNSRMVFIVVGILVLLGILMGGYLASFL